MIGFFGGILFTNFFGKTYVLGIGVLGEYFLIHFQYTKINYNQLFFYIFQERFKFLFIILILGITNIGIPVICGFFLWIGFTGGVFLSVAILKFGLKGLAVSIAGVIPHFLVYVPLFIIYADKVMDKKLTQKIKYKKENVKADILFVLIGIGLWMIGILMESYLNPPILKKMIEILQLNQ
jgi:hypothetical protein